MSDKRMSEDQADLLREAVLRAHKEVQNANLDLDRVTGAGTWDQGDWGSAEVKTIATWQPVDGFVGYRINPLPVLTCGTTGCVAGHICAAAGAHLIVSDEEYEDAIKDGDDEISVGVVLTPDKRIVDVEDYAIEALGAGRNGHITDEGSDLFSGHNTMAEVIEIADTILTEHGHAPTGLG